MNKIIWIGILLLMLVGCEHAPQHKARQITVTIEPLRYFTEQIAGDNFQVNTMVPKGGNPETYEPTPQQMIQLAKSDLYIKVGNIGFERIWMSKLKQNAPHTLIIDSSYGIELVRTGQNINDPHTWMSTKNAIQIARNIYQALAKIDKKNNAYYQENLDKLLQKIDTTDQQIRNLLAKKTSRAFLIYHPALTYFAHDYQLQQIPIEINGREPSASQLKETIQTAKALHVKTFFIQKEFASRQTLLISKSMGVDTTTINPLSAHWQEQMLLIASKIK